MSEDNPQTFEPANLPSIASRVFDTPLMISRPKLETILSVLGPRLGLDVPQLAAAAGAAPEAHGSFKILEGGVAVIPVLGSLVHRTAGLDAMSGLTSYTQISKQFTQALESPQVKSIVFDIDSPGGEANAVFDLSDQIYNARGEKSIIAVSNEQMYSSAYAIGSAADSIYLGRTAGVGSIGVIAAHVDQSARDKEKGLKVTTVFAGERKNDFNPHEELSTEALQILQDHVDQVYGMFVETVARNRGVSTKAVLDTKAGFFIGKSGTKAKLADGVMSAQEAFDKAKTTSSNVTITAKRTTAMSMKGQHLITLLSSTIAASTTENIIDTMAEKSGMERSDITTILEQGTEAPTIEQLGGFSAALDLPLDSLLAEAKKDGFEYPAQAATDKPAPEASNVVSIDQAREQGMADGEKAARAAIATTSKAINEMCVLAGMPQLAGDMISRQLTVDAARTELFAKKTAGEDAGGISSNIDGLSNGLPSVAASWDAAFGKIPH